MTYTIITVPDDAANSIEQLGSKQKFWFSKDDGVYLFKIGRENTGEHWSEKVSGEIANMLQMPHVHYDFAEHRGIPGVISKNFVPSGARLIHGNELLGKIVKEYDITLFKQRKYKIRTVLSLLLLFNKILYEEDWRGNQEFGCGIKKFIGYLMLDAWIGNQDRHHENWGIIVEPSNRKLYLAPTYDHASSLGRNDTDDVKKRKLTTKDVRDNIESYVNRARTPFFDKEQRLTTLEAFTIAKSFNEDAATEWRKRLLEIDIEQIEDIFHKVPSQYISEASIEFSLEMLRINKKRILQTY